MYCENSGKLLRNLSLRFSWSNVLSAAIGFIISLFGASSMAFSGVMFSDFAAPLSIGYVNIPGFLVFVPVTMTMAPIGAKLVHSIDKNLLSKIFGAFLIIISIRAFIEFLNF